MTIPEDEVAEAVDRFLADVALPAAEPAEIWARQFDAGLAWVDCPVGLGGLGAPRHLRNLVDARLAAAEIPDSATANGDGYRIDGQKVWTTLGHIARWGLLCARTDPELPKQAGLAHERATFSDTPPVVWAEQGTAHPELADRYLRLWVRAEAVRLAELAAAAAEDAGTYAMAQPSSMSEVHDHGDVRRAFLFARCSTIAGRTSEIQRTIVADRVLGLPREPQPDRATPWRALRRG